MNKPYKNIRAVVFLRQYGSLLITGTIVIIIRNFWPSASIYGFLGVMSGIVLRILFNRAKYVAGFEIKEEVLQVNYITFYLRKRFYQQALNHIAAINIDETSELSIVTTGKQKSFEIATKKIRRDIEAKVNSANIGFTKSGLQHNQSTNYL